MENPLNTKRYISLVDLSVRLIELKIEITQIELKKLKKETQSSDQNKAIIDEILSYMGTIITIEENVIPMSVGLSQHETKKIMERLLELKELL